MSVVQILIGLVTLGLGITLAVRLLRLGLRARTAPETAMGAYCLAVTLAALFMVGALAAVERGNAFATPLSLAATLCVGLGAFALAVGIWRIFHPGSAAGPVLVALAGLVLFGGWLGTALPGRPVLLSDFTPANLVFVAGRLAIYGVGAVSAFRYATMLKRRVAVGLADPVAAHQIRLWGGAWSCVAGMAILAVAGPLLTGRPAMELTGLAIVSSLLNLTAWVCTGLAFFPPRGYQRWVAGAAGDQAA